MIMIRYIYVFGVSNVLISSFKSPPHAHPLFFMYNLRFGLDLEQENGTLIRSEPKNGFRLRALDKLHFPSCYHPLVTEGQVKFPLLLPHPPAYGRTRYISPPAATSPD